MSAGVALFGWLFVVATISQQMSASKHGISCSSHGFNLHCWYFVAGRAHDVVCALAECSASLASKLPNALQVWGQCAHWALCALWPTSAGHSCPLACACTGSCTPLRGIIEVLGRHEPSSEESFDSSLLHALVFRTFFSCRMSDAWSLCIVAR